MKIIHLKLVLILTFILCFFATKSNAQVLNVPTDYSTIQLAIDASAEGDTILVQPGTYVENINFKGKNIVVTSLFLKTQNPDYIEQTIIDGNKSGSVARFSNLETENAKLIGFTITNGKNSHGGGIYCGTASPTLKNLIISGNHAYNSSSNNSISCYGGGVHCYNSKAKFENILVANNITSVSQYNIYKNLYGAGISLTSGSDVSILNLTIVNNTHGSGTQLGSGIYISNSNPVISNSIIAYNKGGEGIYNSSGSPKISHCNFFNYSGNFYGLSTEIGTISQKNKRGDDCDIFYNIEADPLFMSVDSADYHLQVFSPCIDVADATLSITHDLEGNPRPSPEGTNPDMGAYENPHGFPPAPGIYNILPNLVVLAEKTADIEIVGYRFSPEAEVYFINSENQKIVPQTITFIDTVHIQVNITIEKAQVGDYAVVVKNTPTDSLVLENSFTILDKETIPFNEWVPFQAINGKVFTSGVVVPQVEDLFVLVKKSTRIGYANTWKGNIKLYKSGRRVGFVEDGGGARILGGSQFDYSIQLENPLRGYYRFEIDNYRTDIKGDGLIMFTDSPPELQLGQWDKGLILRPYGSDWKKVVVPEGVDTLYLQTEGLGKWSNIDVYLNNIDNPNKKWFFNNWGYGYNISGKIVNPPAGIYYIKYTDSGVIQKDNSGNLYNHAEDQSREYLIYCGINSRIELPTRNLSVSNLSSSTFGQGTAKMIIEGSGFTMQNEIVLTKGNKEIIAYPDTVYNNGRSLIVTLDLSNANIGEWNIVIRNNNTIIEIGEHINIESAGLPEVNLSILTSSLYRLGRRQKCIVNIENKSNLDINSAYLHLNVDNEDVNLYYSEQYETSADTLNLLFESATNSEIILFITSLKVSERVSYEVDVFAKTFQNTFFKFEATGGFIPDSTLIRIRNEMSIDFRNSLLNYKDLPITIKDYLTEFSTDEEWNELWKEAFKDLGFTLDWNSKKKRGGDEDDYMDDCFETKRQKQIFDIYRKVLDFVAAKTLPYTDIFSKYSNDKDNILGIATNPWKFVNWEIDNLVFKQYSKINRALDDVNNNFPESNSTESVDKNVVGSTTPEDKYGPRGYGGENNNGYISDLKEFEYRIDYWNKEDATAPAAIVYIRDTIDTDFDLSTLSFTEIGFLKWKVKLEGGQYFNVNVDCRPDMPYIVNVEGTVDPDTREVFWVHTTLDPETMDLPEDPLSGYLPPIDETGYQIGWVNFIIQPKEGLPNGTEFTNQARVNFDGVGKWGPAPPYGPYTNVTDLIKPISVMLPLTENTDSTNIHLNFKGTDEGAGVKEYEIYVSIESGEFEYWTTTTDTTAIYIGEDQKTYSFFCIATDNVGNKEDMKVFAEATTLVSVATGISETQNEKYNVQIFPNPNTGKFKITMDNSEQVENISITDITGKTIMTITEINASETEINMKSYAKGVYLLNIKYGDEMVHRKIVID